jgi:Flp pilus assembly protein TadD
MGMRFAASFFAAAMLLNADVIDEARAQYRAGHFDAAIQLLRDAIAKDPAAAPASVLLTEILQRRERFDEADQVINAALARNPDHAELHRVRGDLVFREGQVFEAEKDYKAAYKIDPHDARALYGIARTWDAACLHKKAEGLIRAAHNLDPGDPIVNAAFNHLEGDSPAAISRWESELTAMPDTDSPFARLLTRRIAVARALKGKPEFELASPYGPTHIPLTRLMNGTRFAGWGVVISMGGVKSELQLDSGASGLVISSSLAARAGVQHLADVEIGGIGNETPKKGWIGYAEKVQIGSLEFRNAIVEVSDRGSVVDSGGLIGTNIFQRFLVKLNFFERRIDLDPLPGPAWDGVTATDRYAGPELQGYAQVLVMGHDLLIPMKMSEENDSDPTPGLALIDTGSFSTMVSDKIAGEVTKVHESEYMHVKGLSGKVKKVYETGKIVLQFANFRQPNVGLISFDLSNISRGAGTEVMCIVGLPVLLLFHSVTIDYRDGMVKFEYKPM